MKCPNCGKEVSSEFSVCPWCGYKPKKCSKPEHQDVWLPADARFCPSCGESLSDGSDGQVARGEVFQKRNYDDLSENLRQNQIVSGSVEKSVPSSSQANEDAHDGPRYLWAIVVLAIIGIVGGLWGLVNHNNDDSANLGSSNEMNFNVDGVPFKMIRVEGGSFLMGSPDDDSEADNSEKPQHRVTLSTYYIGETQVTQALWKAVMGDNPSNWKGENLPVEQVSWNDCQQFIKQLNLKTGKMFRLPTEAEWEYAARGGRKSLGFKYAGGNDIDEVAWYRENSDNKTHPVKQKAANELGLYDMSGNVWEWCQDWFGDYESGAQTNPKGPSFGSSCVLRGGGWNVYNALSCRVAYRNAFGPENREIMYGFRLVLVHQ